MLSARAIAVQGLNTSSRLVAVQGLSAFTGGVAAAYDWLIRIRRRMRR